MILMGSLETLLPYAKTYLATDLLALILLLVLTLGNLSLFHHKNLEHKILIFFTIYCFFSIAFEMFAAVVDGMDGEAFVILNKTFGAINHILIVGVGYILALFLNAHFFGRLKKVTVFTLMIPTFVSLILVIINIFYPILFTLDDENNYVRLSGYYVTIGLGVLYLLYSLVLYIYCLFHDKASKYFPFYLFLLPVALGIVFQSFMYGIAMIWPCISIGLAGIVSCFKSEKVYRDELTGLYNRAFFNYIVLKHQNENDPHLAGIMLDINDFKKINDKFGHKFGDNALVEFARQLKKSSPAGSIVIRLSGDEFVILFKTSDTNDMHLYMDAINEGFTSFNDIGNQRPYELFASMGCSTYKRGQSPEDFINAFDREMYAEKARYHSLNTNSKSK